MLAIDIEYLSGVCYAAEAYDDSTAEWPPSPDRLFSALVDSMSAMGGGQAAACALRWLESQGPPEIACPPHGARNRHEAWVPVQDRRGKGRYMNGRGPGLPPVARKPRWFPAMVLPDDDRTVTMSWNEEPPADVVDGIKRLVGGVSRLGHSSSLVRVAVVGGAAARGRMRYVPDKNGRMPIRCPQPGRLDDLLEGYRKSTESGAVWHPSPPAVWPRYSIVDGAAPPLTSAIWGEWKVMAVEGDAPAPESFPTVARAIRSVIADRAGGALPEIVSGIAPGGGPSQRAHMAIVPMLNVGWRHSGGGLLGISLIMPADAKGGPAADLLSGVAGVLTAEDMRITLPGGLAVSLVPADGRLSLQTGRYTRASSEWTTVTPIAVDRHCRAGHDPGPGIADSVERLGLPRPSSVSVSRGGLAYGASHAGRWVRHAGRGGLWHARIEFEEEVPGPVLVGAIRYRGLGLCMATGGGNHA